MNGITNGYLNSSPFAALTLPIITQTTFNTPRTITMGIPIRIIQRGIANTIYNSIDNWKLSEFLPLMFTQVDSSLRDSQQINGPIIPPNGKKKPAKADR
jgi:hypothetical protein